MQYLDYEKLDVYQVAMSLVLVVEEVIERLPIGRAYLVDQVRRSSTSVVLNIAEGAGEHAIAEKNRFYRMAKRSATECASTIEICLRLRLIDETQYTKVRERVIRVAGMLTRLIQSKARPPVSLPAVPVNVPVPLPSSGH
ncbi:MAG: four helix bundle protein [Chlamydiales bacterium]